MSTGRHKQERGVGLQPLDEINGYQVRPGFYNRDGATATTRGVSFTIHSFGATACYLLLFRPQEKEPYVTLKYPEAYHIGNTYSMFVFGLKIEEFEYAFQLDGPYDEKKGLLFKKENVLLDPYARAVTGQRNWGDARKAERILFITQGLWKTTLTGEISVRRSIRLRILLFMRCM